ncbi:COMM domain-containing protein 8 [Bicyclus anynana]|uniref:COMM domain-containing protein 8 n=1 Tax=Bicyclus anynana TaxID=110368 RepID=A0A6J1MLP8_BICAN|nr:COMM domain-containing protein 8 [Bicyclus anynana]
MEVIFKIDAEEDFLHILKEILNNLYNDYNTPIKLTNKNAVATAKDELKDLIYETNCVSEDVYELLTSRGFLKERSKMVASLIESMKSELLYSTLLNHNSVYGKSLAAFDWAVKLVYGTSELKKLKYPLLQLTLTTLSKGKQQQQIFDINKEMLLEMINVLENIDAQS